jgi:protein tyrosine phosphatase
MIKTLSFNKIPDFLLSEKQDIKKEFRDLPGSYLCKEPTIEEFPEFSEGLKNENLYKNRYKNVLPNDSTRVKLEGLPNDYINANHCLKGRIIISQGPLQKQHIDFYHMLWINNCSAIAMVTNFIEGYQEKCSFYLPLDEHMTKTAGKYLVSTQLDGDNPLLDHGIEVTRLFIEHEGEKRTLTHYHMPHWEDQKGTSAKAAALLTSVLLKEQKPLIHCSAGIGRSGTLAVILDVYNKYLAGETSKTLIADSVKELRAERRGCVQSLSQYKTIFNTLKILIFKDFEKSSEISNGSGPNSDIECGGELSGKIELLSNMEIPEIKPEPDELPLQEVKDFNFSSESNEE